MQVIRTINLALYFSVELAMLAALSYIGFKLWQHPYGKYLTAVGLPLAVAVLWGFFAAPNSEYRLTMPYRSLFALTLFALTAFGLHRVGHTSLAIAFGLAALATELTAFLLKQDA